MRRVIVHYPSAHPRLTWLSVTSTAINNIPTITLVAHRMQYAKLLLQSCFPHIWLFIICIHLWLRCFICGIIVSALLF